MTDAQKISRAEHMDLMRENAALRKALKPFVDGHAHTMLFLSRKEIMHRDGRALYTEDVDRARTALSNAGVDAAVVREGMQS